MRCAREYCGGSILSADDQYGVRYVCTLCGREPDWQPVDPMALSDGYHHHRPEPRLLLRAPVQVSVMLLLIMEKRKAMWSASRRPGDGQDYRWTATLSMAPTNRTGMWWVDLAEPHAAPPPIAVTYAPRERLRKALREALEQAGYNCHPIWRSALNIGETRA